MQNYLMSSLHGLLENRQIYTDTGHSCHAADVVPPSYWKSRDLDILHRIITYEIQIKVLKKHRWFHM
jgi:hypothetical protein